MLAGIRCFPLYAGSGRLASRAVLSPCNSSSEAHRAAPGQLLHLSPLKKRNRPGHRSTWRGSGARWRDLKNRMMYRPSQSMWFSWVDSETGARPKSAPAVSCAADQHRSTEERPVLGTRARGRGPSPDQVLRRFAKRRDPQDRIINPKRIEKLFLRCPRGAPQRSAQALRSPVIR